MLQHAGAGGDGFANPAMGQQAADRRIAAAETLGHGEDVRRHVVLGAGIHVAGAAHAAHDLVEDQQHAVAVADFAQALEVAGGPGVRRQDWRRVTGSAMKAATFSGPELADRGIELVGYPDAIGFGGLVGAAVAVFVAGRDMLDRCQQRLVGRAAGHVLAQRQGRQRIAVIAAPPGDEETPRRRATLQMILPARA